MILPAPESSPSFILDLDEEGARSYKLCHIQSFYIFRCVFSLDILFKHHQFENHLPEKQDTICYILLLSSALLWEIVLLSRVCYVYTRDRQVFTTAIRCQEKVRQVMIFHDLIDSSCQGIFYIFRTFGGPCKKIIFHCPRVCGAQINIWIDFPCK